jgi:hypothetical protein
MINWLYSAIYHSIHLCDLLNFSAKFKELNERAVDFFPLELRGCCQMLTPEMVINIKAKVMLFLCLGTMP